MTPHCVFRRLAISDDSLSYYMVKVNYYKVLSCYSDSLAASFGIIPTAPLLGDYVVSCLLLDGILSYNMKQGDQRSLGMDFSDFTYDGNIHDGYMSDGLGQLTDLNDGISDFRLDLQNIGKKVHGWIAWKSDAQPNKTVEILFQFDQVRNFSAVQITANNMPTKDISIFKRVLVFFSVSGKAFSPESVKFSHARDKVESARSVLVPIPFRLGQLVRLLLYFDSKWMMISEIRFLSGRPCVPYSYYVV